MLKGRKVLVLGDYRETVTVVRSLARAGAEVVLACDRPRSPTAASRYVASTWIHPRTGSAEFPAALEWFLAEARPHFVFPVGESILRQLGPRAAAFSRDAVWVHPDLRTVARCFDKGALYSLAASLGLPVWRWFPFDTAERCARDAAQLGFPLVIKRRDSSRDVTGKKALIVRDASALEWALARLRQDDDPRSLLFQRFASGARHNCHFAAWEGRVVALFEQRVLRTVEPDGTGIGTLGVSVAPSPRLRAHCERLVGALGYTGVGCAQFLIDSQGATAFLEINPRLDSTCALPYRLGHDFPRIAIELALRQAERREGAPLLGRPYPVGRRYHWLRGDLKAWLAAVRERRSSPGVLLGWAAGMAWDALTSHHLTFDWRDPAPTIRMYRDAFLPRSPWFGRWLARSLGRPSSA